MCRNFGHSTVVVLYTANLGDEACFNQLPLEGKKKLPDRFYGCGLASGRNEKAGNQNKTLLSLAYPGL